jgi:serine/threonine protein kinase
MPYSLPEYRGEYKMGGRLGESGSGPVYYAQDGSERALAIKVLTASPDPELPDRLRREVNLKQKNILTILALFRNKERICIVTELLEGRNLRELMTEDQSLSLLDRVKIMTQAGEALRYAHTNGIAHRGLKPSHIHVLPDGTVKVRNFSIDLPPEAAQYIAHEQLSGHMVDPLCNIFAYGVILSELTANCSEHPALLTSILQRAMSKDRESRYQSFDELLVDAARLLVQLRKTDLEFTGLFESWPPPSPMDHDLHENVQFTVYRPGAVRPGEWKTLLAFAHFSEQSEDGAMPTPRPIPLVGELTFVPQMNGIEFNPPRVSLLWQESVHKAAFRLRASPHMDGQTVRGQMCVYLGSIIVAQVALKIEVNSQLTFQAGEETLTPVTLVAAVGELAPSPPQPIGEAPQASQPKGKGFGLQWAAAVLLLVGLGGLSWWGLHSRPAPSQIATNIQAAVTPDTADVFPKPVATPEFQPLPVPPPPGQAITKGLTKHYTLTLWSRGTPILPDQVIRGDDPLVQSSFTLDGTVPADASLEVELYLNGVSSGVTDFDPAEKGKRKTYMNPPRDGNYRAVLLVNRQAVASFSFSYQK